MCSEFYDGEKKKKEEEGSKEKEEKPGEGGKDTPMDDSGGAGMLSVHEGQRGLLPYLTSL